LIILLRLALALCAVFPAYICFAGEAREGNMTTALTDSTEKVVQSQWPASSQLVVVKHHAIPSETVDVYALEKKGTAWTNALAPMPAVTGRNGFAADADKREGDGKTPVGIYPLGLAFGYAASAEFKMPYRQMTAQDIWVDDPDSPDYNKLKKRGETRARSFEDMVLPDHRYKYGIVVEYNINPVIPGRGSAIFIHIWKDDKTATSGCVALSEENILKLIRWLDPARKPLILLAE